MLRSLYFCWSWYKDVWILHCVSLPLPWFNKLFEGCCSEEGVMSAPYKGIKVVKSNWVESKINDVHWYTFICFWLHVQSFLINNLHFKNSYFFYTTTAWLHCKLSRQNTMWTAVGINDNTAKLRNYFSPEPLILWGSLYFADIAAPTTVSFCQQCVVICIIMNKLQYFGVFKCFYSHYSVGYNKAHNFKIQILALIFFFFRGKIYSAKSSYCVK